RTQWPATKRCTHCWSIVSRTGRTRWLGGRRSAVKSGPKVGGTNRTHFRGKNLQKHGEYCIPDQTLGQKAKSPERENPGSARSGTADLADSRTVICEPVRRCAAMQFHPWHQLSSHLHERLFRLHCP